MRDGIEVYAPFFYVSFYRFLDQNWEAIGERDEDLLPPDFGELDPGDRRVSEIESKLLRSIHDHILSTYLLVIPRFQNNSEEIKMGRGIKDTSVIVEHFRFWVFRVGDVGPREYWPKEVPVAVAFETYEGYVVPAGFEYHYYVVGEEGRIEVPRIEGGWWQMLFPLRD